MNWNGHANHQFSFTIVLVKSDNLYISIFVTIQSPKSHYIRLYAAHYIRLLDHKALIVFNWYRYRTCNSQKAIKFYTSNPMVIRRLYVTDDPSLFHYSGVYLKSNIDYFIGALTVDFIRIIIVLTPFQWLMEPQQIYALRIHAVRVQS